MIDVDQATLSRIEAGRTEPLKKTLVAIAVAVDDDFGLDWVRDAILKADAPPPSKKDIAEEMSVKEFISLKFGGKDLRRPSEELEMLTKLLDKEVERIKREGF